MYYYYQYEDERNCADIEIPEIVPQSVTDTDTEETQTTESVQKNLKKSTEEINAEIQEVRNER